MVCLVGKCYSFDPPCDSISNVSLSAFTFTGVPFVDSTITLTTTLTASYTGTCCIVVRHPGGIYPAFPPVNQGKTFDTLSVDSGSTYTLSYQMKVSSVGWSWVSASANIQGIPRKQGNYSMRYIGFEHATNSAKVMNDMDSTSDSIIYTNQAKTQVPQTDLFIEGRVIFFDEYQDVDNVGMYGVKVYLYFQKSLSDIDINLVHPVSGKTEGVHYATCDINGHFQFHFTGPTDWSEYKFVKLYVGRENTAAKLIGGPKLLVTKPNGQVEDSTFPFYTRRLPITDLNHIAHSNVIIRVAPPDGAILRNMLLSYDYLHAIHSASNISMPFTLDQIDVLKDAPTTDNPEVDEYNGRFAYLGGTLIRIRQDLYYLYLSAHEYGHYFLYKLLDLPSYWTAGETIKEGYATFQGFAVMNYASAMHNEYPFGDGWEISNLEESQFNPSKFSGVSYSNKNLGVCRFAAHLWGLYDGTSAFNDFYARRYRPLANDDVQGGNFYLGNGTYVPYLPKRVFQQLHDFDWFWGDAEDFYEESRENLSSELQSSVDALWDFVNSSTNTPRMKSAQISSASTNWSPSSSPTEVVFSISDGSYTTDFNYRNFASYTSDGYNIYKSVNNGASWTLINSALIPPTQTSFTYSNSPTIRYKYKITAANPSGDSYNPKYIDLEHVLAQIDGVDALPEGETYTWYANPIHGKAPYTYKWYVKLSSIWEQVSTSSSYTRTCNEDFDLKLEVTDSWGESDATEMHIILTGGQWKRSPNLVDNTTTTFGLSANYPNPFSIESTIEYFIPTEGYVKLEVFDVLGQQVDILVNESLQSGKYSELLKGDKLSAGNYLVKMSFYPTGGGILTDTKWISVVK